jgi:hypothetical protein
MEIFIFVFFGALTGYFAKKKNRSITNWCLGGFLMPAVALLILFFLPKLCAECRQPLKLKSLSACNVCTATTQV